MGLYRAAQGYWAKYHIPLMITETSAGGGDGDKIAWLEKSVNDVRRLRAEGFPIVGYTWWPAIDHLDWDGAMLHQTGHIHPVGMYRLERRPNGTLERIPTGLRDAYRTLIQGGNATAGRAGRDRRPTRATRGPRRRPRRRAADLRLAGHRTRAHALGRVRKDSGDARNISARCLAGSSTGYFTSSRPRLARARSLPAAA